MSLSTKQKQTHRHREQSCGCQGEGGRRGRGGEERDNDKERGRWGRRQREGGAAQTPANLRGDRQRAMVGGQLVRLAEQWGPRRSCREWVRPRRQSAAVCHRALFPGLLVHLAEELQTPANQVHRQNQGALSLLHICIIQNLFIL